MFHIRNLSVLAYANGFTLWHYKTSNTLYEVNGPNYFGDASDMFAVGDMVLLSMGGEASIVTVTDAYYGHAKISKLN